MLESHPELQGCAADCVHCGIRFLTHPRNAGRRNLRCPFGCREHHRRECSRRRSTAYYRSASGKQKKKRLNSRRPSSGSRAGESTRRVAAPQPPPSSYDEQPPPSVKLELALQGVLLKESSVVQSPLLPYVRMIVSLIEGVHFRLAELVELLRQALRQHSIARRRRADYVLAFLHQHPP